MGKNGSGTYRKSDVLCPFYRTDNNRTKTVYCEGLVDLSGISLRYQRMEDYDIQMREFCCKHYRKCEIYEILMRKYED